MKVLIGLVLFASTALAIDYKRTDIFGSVGSDFTLAPRFNGNIGIVAFCFVER